MFWKFTFDTFIFLHLNWMNLLYQRVTVARPLIMLVSCTIQITFLVSREILIYYILYVHFYTSIFFHFNMNVAHTPRGAAEHNPDLPHQFRGCQAQQLFQTHRHTQAQSRGCLLWIYCNNQQERGVPYTPKRIAIKEQSLSCKSAGRGDRQLIWNSLWAATEI